MPSFVIFSTILALLFLNCEAWCDDNYCYSDDGIAVTVIYSMVVGLAAIIAVGIGICCVCCSCCPCYRKKTRTPQTFVAAPVPGFVGLNANGVMIGHPYVTAYQVNPAFPNQPAYPPQFLQQQYYSQYQPPYPPQDPPPYPPQSQSDGRTHDPLALGTSSAVAQNNDKQQFNVAVDDHPPPYPITGIDQEQNRF
ncbi:unnamed protein product [Allacma fusca]|uniref:Uncharacterized protein n=1 Tax=Allacma fusca TaxID=39272 RepID=A0A8J2KCD5_9HEXA|nr:unnamed protein product [Allacma fusca]